MNRVLLTCGGVLNSIFFLFHILLGYQILHLQNVPGSVIGLMEALNVGGTLFILFFAFASLFHQREVMTTRLGRSVLVLVAALYLSRAAEEFILFKFHPMIFAVCAITGGIYAALWLLARRGAKSALAASAR